MPVRLKGTNRTVKLLGSPVFASGRPSSMEMRPKHTGGGFDARRGWEESFCSLGFDVSASTKLILHSNLVCQAVVFQGNTLNLKGNMDKRAQFARDLHTH